MYVCVYIYIYLYLDTHAHTREVSIHYVTVSESMLVHEGGIFLISVHVRRSRRKQRVDALCSVCHCCPAAHLDAADLFGDSDAGLGSVRLISGLITHARDAIIHNAMYIYIYVYIIQSR